MTVALFAGFGALLVASSLLVVLHRNPVTSALFLVLAFCSLAGLYLTMQAEFIGMVQVIVYAGAIMVLFLFVIMYLNLGKDVESGAQNAFRRAIGWLVGAVLLAEAGVFLGRRWGIGPEVVSERVAPKLGNTQELGMLLYSRYLFPFEVTSMVLLVAMVGAVVIAKGRRTPGQAEPSPPPVRVAPLAPAGPAVFREPIAPGSPARPAAPEDELDSMGEASPEPGGAM